MTSNDEGAALVGAAAAALAAGDVAGATAHLEVAVTRGDPPEARELLGGLAYFDDDFGPARGHWERAYRGFRDRGDRRRAARVAAQLAELHWSVLGNPAASRGWLGRARRLLAAEGRCPEVGYVALALVACEWTDVEALERAADEALALAIEFGDTDLEVRALSDGGFALVSQGRVEEGFGRLDEAMAAVTAGEATDLGVVSMSFCAMLSACDQVGSSQRAEEWTRLVAELVLERFGGRPRVLHTHCRLAYGSVLCGAGRWHDGEQALLEVLDDRASSSLGHRADAAARLAHLRVQQGRLDDAAALLAPHEDRVSACAPLAELYLARGQLDLAEAAIRRGLDELVGDRLREGALLALLVEVELARDVDAAGLAAMRLTDVAERCEVAWLRAESLLASGRVAAGRGDHERAAALLADAQRVLGDDERPSLCGTIRVERAAALAAGGDVAGAIVEARAALAIFERLDARPQADRTAALLRSLGAPGRPRTPALRDAVGSLTMRERDVLDLVRQGFTNAEIAGRLYISPKTVEHHVGRVLAKLGVRSRAEAAAAATQLSGS